MLRVKAVLNTREYHQSEKGLSSTYIISTDSCLLFLRNYPSARFGIAYNIYIWQIRKAERTGAILPRNIAVPSFAWGSSHLFRKERSVTSHWKSNVKRKKHTTLRRRNMFKQNNYEVFMNESKMEKCGSWKYSLFGCFVLFFCISIWFRTHPRCCTKYTKHCLTDHWFGWFLLNKKRSSSFYWAHLHINTDTIGKTQNL